MNRRIFFTAIVGLMCSPWRSAAPREASSDELIVEMWDEDRWGAKTPDDPDDPGWFRVKGRRVELAQKIVILGSPYRPLHFQVIDSTILRSELKNLFSQCP